MREWRREMNEELNRKLLELLDSVQSTGKDAYAFLEGELPLLLREIVHYGTVFYTSLAIVFFSLFTTMVVLCLIFIRFKKESPQNDWDIGATITGIFSVIPFGLCIGMTMMAVKTIIAPRLYLLEVIKGLL